MIKLLLKHILLCFIITTYSCTHSFIKNEEYQTIQNEKLQTINNYIKSSEHLSGTQKKAMLNEKPFIGMTNEEAGIAMQLKNSLVTLNGNILHGIYLDSSNNKYHVYFSGITPVVSFWSILDFENVKLTDVEDLRPHSPLHGMRN